MMQLDATPHRAESDLLALCTATCPKLGTAVSEARAVGLPWLTIWGLILQYGPQAIAIIKQIIDALKTPTP